MSTATDRSAALDALLASLPPAEAPEMPESDDPLVVLLQSFLAADATVDKARAGWEKIRADIVDLNDLRVCMADEIVQMIGPRFPLATERSERIRAALRSVYLREHEMSLASLASASKRDVRKYLDTLDGMLPYVAARTLLLGFGGHAVPVDDRLLGQLMDKGVAVEGEDAGELSSWLTRQVKAADGIDVHHRLQAWSETAPAAPSSSAAATKTTAKKSTTKKSSKTTTTKKSSRKAGTKKSASKKTASKSTTKKSTKKSTRRKAASKG